MSSTDRHGSSAVSPGITVTKILIVINAAVFAVLALRGNTQSVEYMLENGALWAPAVAEEYEVYRLLTSVFLHFTFIHLFNNMLLLLFMGEVLEREIGKIRFLILYLGTGIAGNVITVILELRTGSCSISAGASGAVFGILGALLCLLVLNRGRVAYLTGGRMVFFVLYSLYTGFTSSGVNNAAHIGGLIAGYVLMLLLSFTLGSDRKR